MGPYNSFPRSGTADTTVTLKDARMFRILPSLQQALLVRGIVISETGFR